MKNNKSFIKVSRQIPEWLENDPKTFRLLYEFARRARRLPGDITYRGNIYHLNIGEFITGRYAVSTKCGLTERGYRTSYRKLHDMGLIMTIRSTKRMTITKYQANDIFDINAPTERPTERPSKRPTDDLQAIHYIRMNKNGEEYNTLGKTELPSAKDNNPFKQKKIGDNPKSGYVTRDFSGLSGVGEYLKAKGILNPKVGASYKWQDDASSYAKSLGIKKPSSSWFKLFKKASLAKQMGLISATGSAVIDAPNFEMTGDKAKEKYFYKVFNQKLKQEL